MHKRKSPSQGSCPPAQGQQLQASSISATKKRKSTPHSAQAKRTRLLTNQNQGQNEHQAQAQGPQQDESVWIYGLINNIEQLLTNFNAQISQQQHQHQQLQSTGQQTQRKPPQQSIATVTATATNSSNKSRGNKQSRKSSSSSGYSTPSTLSPPFSNSYCSSASCSPASSNSISTSSTRTQTTTTNGLGSNGATSNLLLATSIGAIATTAATTSNLNYHHHHHHHQQQQQHNQQQQQSGQPVPIKQQALLPRSPISRQIKFHEYKGPPQAKRPATQTSTTINNSTTKQQVQAQPQLALSDGTGARRASEPTTLQMSPGCVAASALSQIKQEPAQQMIGIANDTVIASSSKLTPMTSGLVISTQPDQHLHQLQHHHQHQPQQQQRPNFGVVSVQNMHCSIVAPQDVCLQTNFAATQGRHQQILTTTTTTTTTTDQPNAPVTDINSNLAESKPRLVEHQQQQQQLIVPQVQYVQSSKWMAQEHQHQQQQQQQQELYLAQQPRPEEYYINSEGTSCELYDESSNTQQEEDEVYEQYERIEPTIGFGPIISSGNDYSANHLVSLDESVMFSEFVEYQEIPLNVDESEWIKKFLPPCSPH